MTQLATCPPPGNATPAFKTRSEQRLEWLECVGRPLTDEESQDLQRSLHAIYVRNWKLRRLARTQREANRDALAKDAKENKTLLARVEREALRERVAR